MRNSFTFAGTSSLDFGIYTNGRETFGSPARSYETIAIPGRNGELVLDNKRFENYDLKYIASFIYEDFASNIEAFRNFLLSKHSYQRLEDTYHPNEFRMAIYKDTFEPDVWASNDFGQFDVVFNCKPQRFLKSGEQALSFTDASFSITNPTLFNAAPLVRVYGNGTIMVGGTAITIIDNSDYIDLDFETMNAYKGIVSKNRNVELSTNDYPPLVPGINNFTKSSTISRIEVTPRWYII